MSYCRINDESDVYCWHRGDGEYCVAVDRKDPSNLAFVAMGLQRLEWLLFKLLGEGYRVPQSAFDRIEREIADRTEAASLPKAVSLDVGAGQAEAQEATPALPRHVTPESGH